MNICQDIHESHIYKICVWTGKAEYTTFVFVGKEAPCQSILSKLEKNTKLTKSDTTSILQAYGKNYKNKLGLNSKNIKFVYESIYPDDNLNTLRKKIRLHLYKDLHENDLYFWVHKEIQNNHAFQFSLAGQLMKGKNIVSKNNIIKNIKLFTGIDAAFETNKINLNQILTFFNSVTITHVNEPLGVKYIGSGAYRHFFECNPFDINDDVFEMNDFESISDRSMTLENFKIERQTIHVTSVKDVNEKYHELYFPWANKQVKGKPDDIFITSEHVLHEVDKQLGKLEASNFNVDCHVSYLHLRLNGSFTNQEVNLEQLFERFATHKDVPFVKYNTAFKKRYKVFKTALASNMSVRISNEDLNAWVELNPNDKMSKSSQEYLLFKVFLKNFNGLNRYVSVLLFPDSHIDVKYNLKTTEDITIHEISESFKILNNLFASWIEYVDEFTIPKLEKSFWDKPDGLTDVKIVNMASYVNIVCKTTDSNLHDIKLLAESLFPYVSVVDIKGEKDEIIMLQYKRIDNFVKTDNITNFLNQNKNNIKDRDSIIEKIQQTFGISETDAQKEYEKWQSSQRIELVPVGRGMYFRPANASNLTIKVKKVSLGYRIMIDGITRLKYHSRIIGLLKFLFEFGSTKKLKSLRFINQVQNYEKDAYDDEFFADEHKDEEDKFAKISDMDDEDDEFSLQKHDSIENDFFDDFDVAGLENDDEYDKKTALNAPLVEHDVDVIQDEGEQLRQLKKRPTFQYVLNKLKVADKKLFHGNDYSTKCQWSNRRQPLVITPEEKQRIDSNYPGSYDDNFLAFGTDAQKMQKNIYICPEIWCPISKVSMTYEQYVQNGKQCPSQGINEPVIDLSDKYWEMADGKRKPRYVGFTGTGNECLPCCFTIKPETKKTGPNKNQKKIDQCMQNKTPIENPSVKPETTDKYIVGSQFPLDENRFGILPKALSVIFKNTKCGNGGEGTGLIVEATNCFLRRGISHQNGQSFLSCIGKSLFKDEKNIKQLLIENISVEKFLFAKNGELCGMFIDETRSIFHDNEFSEFRKWFLNHQNSYISTFLLTDIYKDILDHSGFGFSLNTLRYFKNFKHILREYLIYNSYTNFMKYLNDDTITKSHEILLDLFQGKDDVFNPYGYNVIVFEQEKDGIFITCPHDLKKDVDLSRPFTFLIKQEHIYEPICNVSQNKGGSIVVKNTFMYKESDIITDVVDFYRKNCKKEIKTTTDAYSIFSYLNSTGYKVKYQVINYNYKLEGFIVSPGMFIPCKHKNPIMKEHSTYIYVDDILKKIKNKVEWPTIKKIFQLLHDITGDDAYKISKVVYEDSPQQQEQLRPLAAIMKDETVVPLSQEKFPIEHYLDNLNIFIGWEDDDPRKTYIDEFSKKDLLFDIVKNEIIRIVKKHDIYSKEVEFLQSADNFFPLAFKKEKLEKIIHNLIQTIVVYEEDQDTVLDKTSCSSLKKKKCKGMCSWNDDTSTCLVKVPSKWADIFEGQLTEILLSRDAQKLKHKNLNIRNGSSNDITFTQNDVIQGTFTKMRSLIENPYAFTNKLLDEYVNTILEKDIVVKKRISLKTILSNTYKDLPVKFNITFNNTQYYKCASNDIGFCVNEQELFVKSYMYDLLYYVHRIINSKIKLSENIFKRIIENRVITDFKTKGQALVEEMRVLNPSFEYLSKDKMFTSHTDILYVMEHRDYCPSEYELSVFSNLVNVRIVILARKTKRNPNEIKCIKPLKSCKQFIIVHQKTEKIDKVPVDRYEPVIYNKDEPQLVFHDIDHPKLTQYIKDACVRWYVVDI